MILSIGSSHRFWSFIVRKSHNSNTCALLKRGAFMAISSEERSLLVLLSILANRSVRIITVDGRNSGVGGIRHRR